MTYAHSTKLELCKAESKASCCERAECFALLLFYKYFSSLSGEIKLENGAAARKMSELTAVCTGSVPQVEVNLRRKGYLFSVTGEPPHRFFGINPGADICREDIMKNILNSCCSQSFLRGVFIACGVISDPSKHYRLEFVVTHKYQAELISGLIDSALGFSTAVSKRQGSYVVYIKDSSQIEDILTFMGASNASMSLMQTKMYKEALNNINRKTNFETANMDKTYSASARQTAAIALIIDEKGLDFIPTELKDLAVARLHNPEMSLKGLSEITGLSRSAVNYKFQRLMKLASKLSGSTELSLKQ